MKCHYELTHHGAHFATMMDGVAAKRTGRKIAVQTGRNVLIYQIMENGKTREIVCYHDGTLTLGKWEV